MRNKLIYFENHGQSFESWVLDENDIIIEVHPSDKCALLGAQVQWPDPLIVGRKPVFEHKEGSPRQAVAPIKEIVNINQPITTD